MNHTYQSRQRPIRGEDESLPYLESPFKITMSRKGMKGAQGQEKPGARWPKDVGNGVKGKKRD